MKRHVTIAALTAFALLGLGEAAALAADNSIPAAPQTATGTAAESGPAAAVAMLESIKEQYRQVRTALLEQNDPAAAARLVAEAEPQVKRVLAAFKGTAVEPKLVASLNGLGELRKALEAGETERAKSIMQELGRLGGELEPRIRSVASGKKVTRLEHVELTSAGIDDTFANAIARTVEAARAVAVETFGFDMPAVIHVSATASAAAGTRLWNDGEDRITLTVPSEDKLRRPALTGTFHLYGFCHEVGHLAMYRVIQQRSWLSPGGAEGWAHYAGSRIVDAVYAREGEKLWPDTYNYLEDGTARLRKQLAASEPDSITQAAGLWQSLGEILGDKGLAPLFAAWAKAQVDEGEPTDLGKALIAQGDKAKLELWWQKAQPVLLVAEVKSDFAVRRKELSQLKEPPKELAQDDGVSAGKSSLGGSGHAVHFVAAGKESYLTAVRVYGSRYGQSQPPRENASIWLCDSTFKKIAEFPCPYALFQRGDPEWVAVPVKPTQVPSEFILCIGFNPTGSKGVYVHHDSAGCGGSLLGLPGSKGRPFPKGDWLIRAVVQDAAD